MTLSMVSLQLVILLFHPEDLRPQGDAWRTLKLDSLGTRLEVPRDWQTFTRDSFLRLTPDKPSPTRITLGFYQPRKDAQYQRWSDWVSRSLARLRKVRTVRRHKRITVGGRDAVRVETVEPRTAGEVERVMVETWIAMAAPSPAEPGEVLVAFFDSAGPDVHSHLEIYDRVVASLTFLREPSTAN
jgi:hypothetical protein